MILVRTLSSVNLLGVGVYIPPFRLDISEIAQVWNKDAKQIAASLGITQKSVAAADEDALTMAVAAAQQALKVSQVNPDAIGAVYVGSESHPYAVKPTASMVGEWLGLGNEYYCADLEFACKAATAGIQIVAAQLESGMIECGLVIGSDKAQSRPGDPLEYAAASCAVALVLGRAKGVAQLSQTTSYTSDTPDFWRRQTQEDPQHLGRFSGKPAYFRHISASTQNILKRTKTKIADYDHVVFHMPNGKFPRRAAKQLGVTNTQLQAGFTQPYIGNPYSASALLGLARVLVHAQSGQSVLMTAYGSGAGADSFIWKVTNTAGGQQRQTLQDQLETNIPIKYTQYLQMMGRL